MPLFSLQVVAHCAGDYGYEEDQIMEEEAAEEAARRAAMEEE